MRFHSACMASV
uniref:Uncharacterized protein n=1 Tax=Rhizophora mucronata TaxID=61149 RepID=A0A2P2PQT2_RHIMU